MSMQNGYIAGNIGNFMRVLYPERVRRKNCFNTMIVRQIALEPNDLCNFH